MLRPCPADPSEPLIRRHVLAWSTAATLLLAGGALPAPGQEADAPPATGARALRGATWITPVDDASGAVTRDGPITPHDHASASDDIALISEQQCHAGPEQVDVDGCTHGDRRGETRVALVGDSKAAQWFSAVDAVAVREGWRLSAYTKTGCSFLPGVDQADYPECREYNDNLLQHLADEPPDIVVVSGLSDKVPVHVRTWSHLRDVGVERVVALYDTPSPGLRPGPNRGIPRCLEDLVPQGDYTRCAYTIREDLHALGEAAEQVDGAAYVDMSEWICPPSFLSPKCPPVVGGVMVYRSGSHITDTYVRSLTDPLHAQLYLAGVAAHPPDDIVSGGLFSRLLATLSALLVTRMFNG